MKNNVRTKLLSCLFIIICLTLIILAFVIDDFCNESIYKNIGLNICSTGASIFGLSAAWEIVCKRSFSREILNLAEVSDNYIDSGIDYIYEKFKDINWRKELRGVKKFTAFLTYGKTWRNYNQQLLEDFGEKNELIIVLPDYRDDNLVDELDKRFSYGKYCTEKPKKDSVKLLIPEAINEFREMGAKIKLYQGTICSTYYFMDEKCIYAPFKHDKKKIDVPAIKSYSGGSFYEFCNKDMKLILENAIDYEAVLNEE